MGKIVYSGLFEFLVDLAVFFLVGGAGDGDCSLLLIRARMASIAGVGLLSEVSNLAEEGAGFLLVFEEVEGAFLFLLTLGDELASLLLPSGEDA